jgi:hypothetical protein
MTNKSRDTGPFTLSTQSLVAGPVDLEAQKDYLEALILLVSNFNRMEETRMGL